MSEPVEEAVDKFADEAESILDKLFKILTDIAHSIVKDEEEE